MGLDKPKALNIVFLFFTLLQVPVLDLCWGQDVGLRGPSDLVQLFLCSRVAIQAMIQNTTPPVILL